MSAKCGDYAKFRGGYAKFSGGYAKKCGGYVVAYWNDINDQKKGPFCINCPEKALILPARKSPEFGSKKGLVGTLTQMHKILDYVHTITYQSL